ncbi:MAG: all-trans-retinol 13,14-reductase [Planctomycetota bacterium]|jgi:all-trans-retinol 13,14-reductase
MTYGLAPDEVSLIMGLSVPMHYLGGAYYPIGGGQVLSDALVKSIEASGGQVVLKATATRIAVERGKVTGVEFVRKPSNKHYVACEQVVSNADLQNTLLDLIDEGQLKPKDRVRTASHRMAPGLGIVYLGLKRDLRSECHPITNHYVFPEVGVEQHHADVRALKVPTKPFVYITSSTLKDPTSLKAAPAGCTNLQLMTVVPSDPRAWGVTEEQFQSGAYRRSDSYQAAKEEFMRRCLRTAERSIPGISDQICFQEVATPLTHQKFTKSRNGTPFGIASTPDQFLLNRPGPKTSISGLYLCGSSCRTGTGIIGVSHSGVVAAGKVLKKNLVRRIFGS